MVNKRTKSYSLNNELEIIKKLIEVIRKINYSHYFNRESIKRQK